MSGPSTPPVPPTIATTTTLASSSSFAATVADGGPSNKSDSRRLAEHLTSEYLLMRGICTRFPPHKAAALADAFARVLLFHTTSSTPSPQRGGGGPSSPRTPGNRPSLNAVGVPLRGSPQAANAPLPPSSTATSNSIAHKDETPSSSTTSAPPVDRVSTILQLEEPTDPSQLLQPPQSPRSTTTTNNTTTPPPPFVGTLRTLLLLISTIELENINASSLADIKGFMRGNSFGSLLLDRLLEGLPTECVRLPVKVFVEGLLAALLPSTKSVVVVGGGVRGSYQLPHMSMLSPSHGDLTAVDSIATVTLEESMRSPSVVDFNSPDRSNLLSSPPPTTASVLQQEGVVEDGKSSEDEVPPHLSPLALLTQLSKLQIDELLLLSEDRLREVFTTGTEQVVGLMEPFLASLSTKAQTRWPSALRTSFKAMIAYVLDYLSTTNANQEGNNTVVSGTAANTTSTDSQQRQDAQRTVLTTTFLLRFVCPLLSTACRDALASNSQAVMGSPKIKSMLSTSTSLQTFPPEEADTAINCANFVSKCVQKAASGMPPLVFSASSFSESGESEEHTHRLALIEALCIEASATLTERLGTALTSLFRSLTTDMEGLKEAAVEPAPFLRYHPHLSSIPQCCSVLREVIESEGLRITDRMGTTVPLGIILHLPRLLHVTRYFQRRSCGAHRTGNAEALYGPAELAFSTTTNSSGEDPSPVSSSGAPAASTRLMWERAIEAISSFTVAGPTPSSKPEADGKSATPATTTHSQWEALVRHGCRTMAGPELLTTPHNFITFCGLNTNGEAVLCVSGVLLAASEMALYSVSLNDKDASEKVMQSALKQVSPSGRVPLQGVVEFDLISHIAAWLEVCIVLCKAPVRLLVLPLHADATTDAPSHHAINKLNYSYAWLRSIFSLSRGLIPANVLSQCRSITIVRQYQSLLTKTTTLFSRLRGTSTSKSPEEVLASMSQVEQRGVGEPPITYFQHPNHAIDAELALGLKHVPSTPPHATTTATPLLHQGTPIDWSSQAGRVLVGMVVTALAKTGGVFTYPDHPHLPTGPFGLLTAAETYLSGSTATTAVGGTNNTTIAQHGSSSEFPVVRQVDAPVDEDGWTDTAPPVEKSEGGNAEGAPQVVVEHASGGSGQVKRTVSTSTKDGTNHALVCNLWGSFLNPTATLPIDEAHALLSTISNAVVGGTQSTPARVVSLIHVPVPVLCAAVLRGLHPAPMRDLSQGSDDVDDHIGEHEFGSPVIWDTSQDVTSVSVMELLPPSTTASALAWSADKWAAAVFSRLCITLLPPPPNSTPSSSEQQVPLSLLLRCLPPTLNTADNLPTYLEEVSRVDPLVASLYLSGAPLVLLSALHDKTIIPPPQ